MNPRVIPVLLSIVVLILSVGAAADELLAIDASLSMMTDRCGETLRLDWSVSFGPSARIRHLGSMDMIAK